MVVPFEEELAVIALGWSGTVVAATGALSPPPKEGTSLFLDVKSLIGCEVDGSRLVVVLTPELAAACVLVSITWD